MFKKRLVFLQHSSKNNLKNLPVPFYKYWITCHKAPFECIAELTRKKGNTQEGKNEMTKWNNSQSPRLRLRLGRRGLGLKCPHGSGDDSAGPCEMETSTPDPCMKLKSQRGSILKQRRTKNNRHREIVSRKILCLGQDTGERKVASKNL